MMLHEKGKKAERDRAILINSYETMADEFRLPASKRLSSADIARMSNQALYQASKDVYTQAKPKQLVKLAVKMGLVKKPDSWVNRAVSFLKKVKYAKAN
jgi:hypothetical protein